MSAKRSVVLDIAGQRLSLKTDRDNESLKALSSFVGDQVEALRKAAPQIPMEKVCLLVALQIADTLFEERQSAQGIYEEFEQRSQQLLRLLDDELEEAPAQSWSQAPVVPGPPQVLRR